MRIGSLVLVLLPWLRTSVIDLRKSIGTLLLACCALYLSTIQAAFNALMRVTLRLLAEGSGQRPVLELRAADPTTGTAPPGEPHDDVLAAVRALPGQQRAVVVLFYFEDRPMPEVAEIVGCSVSTGWNHLHRARKRLATLLDEDVTDDVS